MSNWDKLKAKIEADPKKRKRSDDTQSKEHHKRSKSKYHAGNGVKKAPVKSASTPAPAIATKGLETMVLDTRSAKIGKYLALDCEMVGTNGPPVSSRERSTLARISITNYNGHVIYDSYVKPTIGHEITDYRTWISGIQPHHLYDAPTFEHVQDHVKELLKGRVVIGHALFNDFRALQYSHPKHLTRDTASLPDFKAKYGNGHSPALKKVVLAELGLTIQGAEHSSIEDARACMTLYRKYKPEFEERAKQALLDLK